MKFYWIILICNKLSQSSYLSALCSHKLTISNYIFWRDRRWKLTLALQETTKYLVWRLLFKFEWQNRRVPWTLVYRFCAGWRTQLSRRRSRWKARPVDVSRCSDGCSVATAITTGKWQLTWRQRSTRIGDK